MSRGLPLLVGYVLAPAAELLCSRPRQRVFGGIASALLGAATACSVADDGPRTSAPSPSVPFAAEGVCTAGGVTPCASGSAATAEATARDSAGGEQPQMPSASGGGPVQGSGGPVQGSAGAPVGSAPEDSSPGGSADGSPTTSNTEGSSASPTLGPPSASTAASTATASSSSGPLDPALSASATSVDPVPSSGAPPAEPLNLPGGVIDLFPRPGATAVCPDPTLRITFAGEPQLANAGHIRVYATGESAPRVDIDLAESEISRQIAGNTFRVPRPVYIDGSSVVVSLPTELLGYGADFEVEIDDDTLVGPSGESFNWATGPAWSFSTRAAAPSDLSVLPVASHAAAPFCTLQGALNAVPNDNESPVLLQLAAQSYFGVVYFSGKHHVTLRGAGSENTRILGVNNNNLNPSTRGRALFGADNVNDLRIEQLSIENLTPQGGSQAEALRLQNCDRCSVHHARLLSRQDTLLLSGRLYVADSLIAGNVDYIWGTGTAYFERCEIRTLERKGYIVQARNAANRFGYVFVDCKLSSDPGVQGDVLARIDSSEYPDSNVAYVDCEMGPHIDAAGWLVTGGNSGRLRFWEYGSVDSAGQALNTSQRATGSQQLTAAEAEQLRDPAYVLDGWQPQ